EAAGGAAAGHRPHVLRRPVTVADRGTARAAPRDREVPHPARDATAPRIAPGDGTMTDHDRIEELIAARALGALDPHEVTELDGLRGEHGPDCVTCRAHEDDYGEVAGRLAFAAEPAAIPAG